MTMTHKWPQKIESPGEMGAWGLESGARSGSGLSQGDGVRNREHERGRDGFRRKSSERRSGMRNLGQNVGSGHSSDQGVVLDSEHDMEEAAK